MGRSKSKESPERNFALLETPGGFALFYIDNEVFKDRDGIWSYLTEPAKARLTLSSIDFVKIDDKSVTRRNDGPGKDLTKLIEQYCKRLKMLYVKDKELRRVIHSNLKIKCCDDDYVVDELMWGLNNLAYDLIFEDRENLSPGYHLSPPQGLMKCLEKFDIKIPAEAIDKEFIINAGGLYQCNAMLRTTGEDLRESCERYVPGISALFKDDMEYAEVMAKILCPGLLPDWDFSKKYGEEIAKKLQDADAAAGEARIKLGYQAYHFMNATFLNLRCHPGIIQDAVKFLKSRANELSVDQNIHVGEKRSLSEPDLSADEVTSSQDTYNSNYTGDKRAKIAESLETEMAT